MGEGLYYGSIAGFEIWMFILLKRIGVIEMRGIRSGWVKREIERSGRVTGPIPNTRLARTKPRPKSNSLLFLFGLSFLALAAQIRGKLRMNNRG
mgnify:CR=1 FL=1